MSRLLRAALVATLVASGLVVAAPSAHAEVIPETLGHRAPVRVGGVAPAFPIDYVGVFWDVPAGTDSHGHAADGGHGHGDAPHGEVRFRHSGRWGTWMPLVEDGAQAEGRWTGSLVAANDAEAYQVRGVPQDAIRPQAVALNTTDGPAREIRRRPASAHALPMCVSRYDWGADETLGSKTRAYADVQIMSVHHTATSNDDADPKATVRAIHRYHTVDNGWDDVGYNYFVDEAGRLYEGRWSGADSEPCESDPQHGPGVQGVVGDGRDFAHNGELDHLVTGAHTGGYNTGNIGVALLGDFRDHKRYGAEPKDAAIASLEDTLADLGARHGFTYEQLNGDTKINYDNGVNRKTVHAISGHRDFTSTECPGQRLYDRFPTIRQNTANKLGADGTPNTAPTASFTYGCTDLACTFDGRASSDGDGTVSSYAWDFGDKTIASGATASHTYAAAATYTVTLTVADDAGAIDTSSQQVTVSAPASGGSTLSAAGYKVKGVQHADLTWTGAASASVDIYRNGAKVTTTTNDGAYTDNIGGKGNGSYTYSVCEAGTTTCSNNATVAFG